MNILAFFWLPAAYAMDVTATYTQEHYRFLYDDASLNAATGYAAADTAISGVARSTNFRLRLALQQTASSATVNLTVTPKLQFKASATACTDATGWTDVPTQTSCSSNPVCQATSSNFADGGATAQRFYDGHTFLAADGIETDGTPNAATFSGVNTQHAEWEWMLTVTTNAVSDTSYTLRIVYSSGTAFEAYGQCATLTTFGVGKGGADDGFALSSAEADFFYFGGEDDGFSFLSFSGGGGSPEEENAIFFGMNF